MDMIWFVIALIFSTLLQLINNGRLPDQEKDINDYYRAPAKTPLYLY